MDRPSRLQKLTEWRQAINKDKVAEIAMVGKAYNACLTELDRRFSEKDTAILKQKRIIGCTTTAAAKYANDIQLASPEVLLVEEAGEILESHVLTALGPNTEQLILIGDHKYGMFSNVDVFVLIMFRSGNFDRKSTTTF